MAGGGGWGGWSDAMVTGLGVVVAERGEVPGEIGELLLEIMVLGGVGDGLGLAIGVN
jgi:uncharacterized protein YgfB (UPF0149 family)